MTDEEKELYKSWTKKQVYEAYLLEYKERVRLNKRVNELIGEMSFIKYDLKQAVKLIESTIVSL